MVRTADETEVRGPSMGQDFSRPHVFETGLVAHPALCQMGTWGSIPRENAAGA
jgi:hypothetical protein